MRESFFQGAIVLAIGSLISRILGFLYRIYVVRLIGAEGIGLYEMVFPVISLILVLTTAGIPVALANLVATLRGEGKNNLVAIVLRISFLILAVTGILFPTLILHLAPSLLPKIYPDPRAYWPFMSMLPAIFFVSLSSVLRGYFQGISFMLPTAIAQLSEQLFRFAIGLVLVVWLLPYGIEFSAAGLAIAVVAGEICGLIVLLVFYRKNSPSVKTDELETRQRIEIASIFCHLITLAFPVTMSRIVSTSMLSLKAIIIPNRLQAAGVTLKEATQLYGAFSGMAMSLVSFPTVITGALSVALLPAIAMAASKKHHKELQFRINQGIKLTVLVALPFTVWFFLLSEPLTKTLFNNKEAAILLKFLAPSCVFIYLQQSTAGILQGLGKMNRIFLNSLLGNLLGLLITYIFVGNSVFKIVGATFGLGLSAVTISSLNLYSIFKFTAIEFKIANWLYSFLLATALMILFIVFFGGSQPLFLLIILSGLIYLIIIIFSKGITKDDF